MCSICLSFTDAAFDDDEWPLSGELPHASSMLNAGPGLPCADARSSQHPDRVPTAQSGQNHDIPPMPLVDEQVREDEEQFSPTEVAKAKRSAAAAFSQDAIDYQRFRSENTVMGTARLDTIGGLAIDPKDEDYGDKLLAETDPKVVEMDAREFQQKFLRGRDMTDQQLAEVGSLSEMFDMPVEPERYPVIVRTSRCRLTGANAWLD